MAGQSEQKRAKRCHPGLPTLAEARQNYDEVISNHVPIRVKVPLSTLLRQPLFGNQQTITIASWNLMGDAQLLKESDKNFEKKTAHTDRIIDSIQNILSQKDRPTILALQGCSPHLFAKLREEVGGISFIPQAYQIAENTPNRCITIYNCEQLTCGLPAQDYIPDSKLIPNYTSFLFETGKGRKFLFHNIQMRPGSFPDLHKPEIRKFLTSRKDYNTIAIGDFGVPVYGRDPSKNIITAVTPAYNPDISSQSLVQEAKYIDACFYSDSIGEIHQPNSEGLNPRTGCAFSNAEITLEKPSGLIQEKSEEFAPVLSFDDDLDNTVLSAFKCTEGIQSFLENLWEDSPVRVCIAQNLRGERRIYAILPAKKIQSFLADEESSGWKLIYSHAATGLNTYLFTFENFQEIYTAIRKPISPESLSSSPLSAPSTRQIQSEEKETTTPDTPPSTAPSTPAKKENENEDLLSSPISIRSSIISSNSPNSLSSPSTPTSKTIEEDLSSQISSTLSYTSKTSTNPQKESSFSTRCLKTGAKVLGFFAGLTSEGIGIQSAIAATNKTPAFDLLDLKHSSHLSQILYATAGIAGPFALGFLGLVIYKYLHQKKNNNLENPQPNQSKT